MPSGSQAPGVHRAPGLSCGQVGGVGHERSIHSRDGGWRNPGRGPIFQPMPDAQPSMAQPTVQVAHGPDGTPVYLLDHPPTDLPPVHGRDLAAAWDAAREAALHAARGSARRFRFRHADGSFTDLALHDRDAACWTAAAAAGHGLQTAYGVSLCLRLLALVDLLGRARALHGLLQWRRGAAELHPSLLRAAATAPLTNDARFDEARFRARLGPAPLPLGAFA